MPAADLAALVAAGRTVFLPVVHVGINGLQEALNNVEIALRGAGADGVFLIEHDGMGAAELLRVAQVRRAGMKGDEGRLACRCCSAQPGTGACLPACLPACPLSPAPQLHCTSLVVSPGLACSLPFGCWQEVRRVHPEAWLGINFLDLEAEAAFGMLPPWIDGLWASLRCCQCRCWRLRKSCSDGLCLLLHVSAGHWHSCRQHSGQQLRRSMPTTCTSDSSLPLPVSSRLRPLRSCSCHPLACPARQTLPALLRCRAVPALTPALPCLPCPPLHAAGGQRNGG